MNTKALIYGSIVVSLTMLSNAISAQVLDWQEYTTDASDGLIGGDYGSGQYVIASRGANGGVLRSEDAENWIFQPLGHDLQDVAFGNGRFVTVGSSGSMLTSTDGTSWTELPKLTNFDIQGIHYAQNMFLAVGSYGDMLASTDGLNWTTRPAITNRGYYDVAFADGLWVTVGTDNLIFTSTDTINWTDELNNVIPAHGYHGVGYGNNTWVAVGNPGSRVFTSSGDGNWTQQNIGVTASHDAVASAYGRIFITTYDGEILSSLDGITWDLANTPVPYRLAGMEYLNGKLMAFGVNGQVLVVPEPQTYAAILLAGIVSIIYIKRRRI